MQTFLVRNDGGQTNKQMLDREWLFKSKGRMLKILSTMECFFFADNMQSCSLTKNRFYLMHSIQREHQLNISC